MSSSTDGRSPAAPVAAMTPQARARRLIDSSQNLVVATVGTDGQPWISPVFYVPDGSYDLYWTSERTARHSANIRDTGVAAIVIWETEPGKPVDAVYMTAEVVELNDPGEVAAAIAVMATKRQPDRWMIESAGDVTGDGPWRIYRAHPTTMDVRANGVEAGKAVARREPADFRA